MKDHVLEFTKSGTKITKSYGHMIVSSESGKIQIPLDDINGVIILGADISISTTLIAALLTRNVAIQFSDEKYLPLATLASTTVHHLSRKRQVAQQELSETQIKRLWQRIVSQKIYNQAEVLTYCGRDPSYLEKFAAEVTPGDSTNLEAQAARSYWKTLFGPDFSRDPVGMNPNNFLNYGYAVIRNSMARATVATGLSPHLGIFHSNMSNPFCLVDDLMEPFRPAVDLIVHGLGESSDLTPLVKRKIVGVLQCECLYGGENKKLLNAMHEFCHSFCAAIMAGDYKIFDPNVKIIYEKE